MKSEIKNLLLRIVPDFFHSLRHLRYISGWKDLFYDIKADKKSANVKKDSDHHLFFIAGMPKAGTTWLEQLIGFHPMMVKLNGSVLRKYPSNVNLEHPHDLDYSMFTCAPRDKYSFLKLHPNPNVRNFDILRHNQIKTIILIRDIRDVLISDYFHSLHDRKDFNYKKLQNLTTNDGLFEQIKSIHPSNKISNIEYYSKWLDGWIDRSMEDPSNHLIIKYEDMHNNLETILKKIFDFYEFKIDKNEINSLIFHHMNNHNRDFNDDLKHNLNKKGRRKSTFRKGKKREWELFFKDDEKSILKQYLTDVLIKSGYEKDDSW